MMIYVSDFGGGFADWFVMIYTFVSIVWIGLSKLSTLIIRLVTKKPILSKFITATINLLLAGFVGFLDGFITFFISLALLPFLVLVYFAFIRELT